MASTTERINRPHTNRLLKPALYLALLATIGVLAFYFSWRLVAQHHASNSLDFHLVQYGDTPRPIKLRPTAGEVIDIPTPGRYSLVQYISAESSRTEQVILYAQYLSRSQPSDVNYIIVVNPSAKELATNLSKLVIPNIRVSVDKGHRYVQSMGLPVDADSGIALDGAGIVRFSTLGLIVPNALRVLYNRYSGGPDDKNVDAPMPPYRIGEQIPPFQVRDIRSDRLLSSLSLISSAQKPLWIFTADCAMCSLPEYLKNLRLWLWDRLAHGEAYTT